MHRHEACPGGLHQHGATLMSPLWEIFIAVHATATVPPDRDVEYKMNAITFQERPMLSQQQIDEFSAKVRELLAKTPARDIETNMRAMLTSMFARLDLVTRHEFDIQTELLARTRDKLAALEAKLAALEDNQKV